MKAISIRSVSSAALFSLILLTVNCQNEKQNKVEHRELVDFDMSNKPFKANLTNKNSKKKSNAQNEFWNHLQAPLKVVNQLDLSREDISKGTIWLPIDLGGMGLQDGPYVKMCLINYRAYQKAPWEIPMFEMLQKAQCNRISTLEEGRVVIIRLSSILKQIGSNANQLEFGGFIFHDTRCGSTLVANQLAVLPENRVFSESKTPTQCLRTFAGYQLLDASNPNIKMTQDMFEECIKGLLALFSRVRGPSEPHKRLFFKFQNSRFSPLITSMFPEVPWVYVFRDPVEVMVSNIGRGELGAPCVREGLQQIKMDPEKSRDFFIRAKANSMTSGKKPLDPIIMEKLGKICADWLLSLDKAAFEAYTANPGNGAFLDYKQLPEAVPDFLYTVHFKIEDDQSYDWRAAMKDATSHYSKGTNKQISQADTLMKHEIAAPEIVRAAEIELYDSYNALQNLISWQKP